jgi:hypothetical protein
MSVKSAEPKSTGYGLRPSTHEPATEVTTNESSLSPRMVSVLIAAPDSCV